MFLYKTILKLFHIYNADRNNRMDIEIWCLDFAYKFQENQQKATQDTENNET